MSTEDNKGADERACPFCAETIKSAAIVCKHCKRDLPLNNADVKTEKKSSNAKESRTSNNSVEISAETIQKQRSATNQKTWGIIFVVFGVLALISGDYSAGKFLFFILIPLALGIWLIQKGRKLQASIPDTSAPTSSQNTSPEVSKSVTGVTSQVETLTKVVSEK